MENHTAFMRFWYTINLVLKSHGLPDMLYGEARDYWRESELALANTVYDATTS